MTSSGREEIFLADQAFLVMKPTSCLMGTGSSVEIKRPEHGFDQQLSSGVEVANGLEIYFLHPSVPVHACHKVTFTFTNACDDKVKNETRS
jgi:hypothetical protein